MTKVFVTPHARTRFKERFQHKYMRAVFEDGRDIYILTDFFNKAVPVDFALRMRNGDYNALCVKYGCLVRYSKFRDIVFVWMVNHERNNILLLTVLQEGCKVRNIVL